MQRVRTFIRHRWLWLFAAGVAAGGALALGLSGSRNEAESFPPGVPLSVYPLVGVLDAEGWAPIDGSGSATSTPLGWGGEPDAAPAALPDGSVLFPDGDVVWRIWRDGRLRRAAGRPCEASPCRRSGDGGPARDARFRWLGAIAAARDGSYLVVDGYDDREGVSVRRVDRKGVIATVARGVRLPADVAATADGRLYLSAGRTVQRITSHGAAGVAAHLAATVSDLVAAPGGALLALEPGRRRIVRITPDMRTRTWVTVPFRASGLAPLPDGGALTIDRDRQRIVRVRPVRPPRTVLPRSRFLDWFEVPKGSPFMNAGGRRWVTPLSVAVAGDAILIVTDLAVLIATQHPSTRLMVRIRTARTIGDRVQLLVQTSRSADLDIALIHGSYRAHTGAHRLVRHIPPGRHWLDVPRGRSRTATRTVRVTARAAGSSASDFVHVLVERKLSMTIAGNMIFGETTELSRASCHRLAARRIDCVKTAKKDGRCMYVAAFIAGSDTRVRERHYGCPRKKPWARRRPRWFPEVAVLDPPYLPQPP